MAEQYRPPIGGIPSTLLNLTLSITKAFTGRITHLPSRKIVTGVLDGSINLVKALSDSNPEDEDQIRAIVNKLITDGDFYEGSRQTILDNIQKVKNQPAREALTIGVDEVYNIGAILTDDIDDNGEQLRALLSEFLSTAEGVSFITSLLKIAVDEQTANIIALILIESLKGVVSKDKAETLNELKRKLIPELA
jgi:hypothetical protein